MTIYAVIDEIMTMDDIYLTEALLFSKKTTWIESNNVRTKKRISARIEIYESEQLHITPTQELSV